MLGRSILAVVVVGAIGCGAAFRLAFSEPAGDLIWSQPSRPFSISSFRL
jgi:hypothetical protein